MAIQTMQTVQDAAAGMLRIAQGTLMFTRMRTNIIPCAGDHPG